MTQSLIFNKPENPLLKSTILPVMDKIQEKIPEKLETTLNIAFYKGFQLVFEKGSPYIEKTYNKEKIEMDFDINNYAINKDFNKRHIKRLDKQSKQSSMVNSSFSALEGGVLGLLGIGLPDIPLFLSVMVKTIYEVALSYGFPYNSDDEAVYILLLISAAITKGETQKNYDNDLEQQGIKIDHNIVTDCNPDLQMEATAKALSDALLAAKFLQGIPVVGVVGGAVNYNILNKVSNYARIKYKKRYLMKKLSE
ncbi:MAG: EcsC family protein [Herbinix sp.]|nr:EcsC family protein [Herbinix sp.]